MIEMFKKLNSGIEKALDSETPTAFFCFLILGGCLLALILITFGKIALLLFPIVAFYYLYSNGYFDGDDDEGSN
jgi:hypothetical protein